MISLGFLALLIGFVIALYRNKKQIKEERALELDSQIQEKYLQHVLEKNKQLIEALTKRLSKESENSSNKGGNLFISYRSNEDFPLYLEKSGIESQFMPFKGSAGYYGDSHPMIAFMSLEPRGYGNLEEAESEYSPSVDDILKRLS